MSDDGKVLMAVDHPVEIEVTQAMLVAGFQAYTQANQPQEWRGAFEMLKAIFIAMVKASPPIPELGEGSMEEVEIELHLNEAQLQRQREVIAFLEGKLRGFDSGDQGCDTPENTAEEIIEGFYQLGFRL